MDISAQKNFFRSGATRPLKFRLAALERLEHLLVENKEQICGALYADLRKPKQEALISEVAVLLEEIHLTKKNLRHWMKPEWRWTPLTLLPGRSRIYFEPLGVVLIIGPWNYPLQLALAPLIGAIAAGNCAVIKPSELTPKTSSLIATLVRKYFAAEFVSVVEGGVAETTALLTEKFDHIFFTGSTPVGKIIMQAAAKNLVPVTLELGGKSPVVVTEDADLALAARRIVWGKFYNAGQTCVAPDYLCVHQSVARDLLLKIKEEIGVQFGLDPKLSDSFSRLVNERNCQRIAGMMDSKKIVHGGRVDISARYIDPTVMENVTWSDAIMQEEIFGPVLPILTYENFDSLIETLNAHPKPLSAYLFSSSKNTQMKFVEKVSFGGGCINDVIVHLSNPHLPFGGVGESGMGNYHGHKSFLTFSHSKSVMFRTNRFDFSARYAPYSDEKLKFLRRIFGI